MVAFLASDDAGVHHGADDQRLGRPHDAGLTPKRLHVADRALAGLVTITPNARPLARRAVLRLSFRSSRSDLRACSR